MCRQEARGFVGVNRHVVLERDSLLIQWIERHTMDGIRSGLGSKRGADGSISMALDHEIKVPPIRNQRRKSRVSKQGGDSWRGGEYLGGGKGSGTDADELREEEGGGTRVRNGGSGQWHQRRDKA